MKTIIPIRPLLGALQADAPAAGTPGRRLDIRVLRDRYWKGRARSI